MLEELPPIIANRSSYRTTRYLYYFIVPHLSRYLWYKPDRERLNRVEIDLYNDLLLYSFWNKTFKEPNRIPLWLQTRSELLFG